MKYTKDKEFVGKMFDEISPSYDRLNHFLSGYQDNRWRKKAIKILGELQPSYNKILDLASGSGDLGIEFMKLHPQILYSVDISREMLKINDTKLSNDKNITLRAEAEHLPFADGVIDLCGVAFGVRNFQDLEECIREIARVIKPGGIFLTIEMFKPFKDTITNRSFKVYFEKVLPKLGNKLSNSKYAYDYLFESVDNFITVDSYNTLLMQNNFKFIKVKNNFLGIVHSVFAEKL